MINDFKKAMINPTRFLTGGDNVSTLDMSGITVTKPIFKERPEIEKIIEEIKHYYLNDDRPFAIGFSGGKDSTVTADLVMKALLRVENPTKPIYLQHSDTGLEMDNTVAHINKALEDLDFFAKKYHIPLKIKKVLPIPTESYMYLLAGRGYSVPRRDNRWCTDRLKLRPQAREIEEMRNMHSGGYLNIVGTRHSESQDRSDRISKNTLNGMYKLSDSDKLSNVLMPVEHMKDADIWRYIYTESSEWVDGTELGRVYGEANQHGDKECSSLLEGLGGHEDYKAGCSNSARYGCWICTLFEKDKTLNSLATHYDYMTHMEEFRNWLTGFRDGRWDTRDLYYHGGHVEKMYNRDNHRFGMTSVGGYSLDFRKEIIDRMLDLDTKVYPERGIRIITDEEIANCQRAWVEEGDLDLSLLAMLQEKQNRTIELTEDTHELIALAKLARVAVILNNKKEDPTLKLRTYFHGEMSDRFFVQFALQLRERTVDPLEYLKALSSQSSVVSEMDALRLMTNLPALTKQFFPTEDKERIVREEWENDKAYIHTTEKLYWKEMIEKPESNLFGFDGDHYRFFEHLNTGLSVDEDPNLSLEEQYAFFDDWREEDHKELAKQLRNNIQNDRPVFEGIEERDNLLYNHNMKKITAEAIYSPTGEDHVSVAQLNGKAGVDFIVNEEDLPVAIVNMINDKNAEFIASQVQENNRLKRDEVKSKKKADAEERKMALK